MYSEMPQVKCPVVFLYYENKRIYTIIEYDYYEKKGYI